VNAGLKEFEALKKTKYLLYSSEVQDTLKHDNAIKCA
jgi:hypothetical protein